MIRLLALASAVALAAGCRAGSPPEELPEQPIAFMRQEARKGVLSLDEFRGALRIPNPSDPQTLKPRRATTLSLIHPPTGEVTAVPGAVPGALPLDWSPDGVRLLLGRYDAAARVFSLVVWNRLTGAWEVPRPSASSGEASIGQGPIRLAQIGRVSLPAGGSELGVRIYVDRRGLLPLAAAAPGGAPDIAPDGRTIIFERPSRRLNRDGVLLRLRLGDESARPFGRGSSPRFSQDGKWITFLRRRDGQTDVWLMRSDGSGKRALTSSSYDEEFPAVSPRGRYVVFASVRPPIEESQLYLVRVKDRREIQLTRTGQNSRPLW